MTDNKLMNQYFKWLVSFVCDARHKEGYSIVLHELFNREFIWLIDYDENLAIYGLEMRDKFLASSETYRKMYDIYGGFDQNCTILEMMVALAIIIEERVMTNYEENRTSEWFWGMMTSLGLINYDDMSYDEEEVDEILEKFLYRKYQKNGVGGLFTIKNGDKNMCKIDIWLQINAFLIEMKAADW